MRYVIRAWLNHYRDRLEQWAANTVLDAFADDEDDK